MLSAWGCQGELILFPCRIWEGGGRILAHQRGSVKFGVEGDWGGALGRRALVGVQSLGHYLGETMTLWNLSWDNPCRAHSYSTYYSPHFQSSATGPACPMGGGEEGVDLAKLKSLYPQRGVKVMLRSSIWWRYDRNSLGLTRRTVMTMLTAWGEGSGLVGREPPLCIWSI